MDLNLFNKLDNSHSKDNSNNFVNNFIKELQDYMKDLFSHTSNQKDLYTIDRFEGDNEVFAVCENRITGKMVDIPLSQISPNAVEDDIIKYENGMYVVDEEQNRIVGERMKKLSEKVFKK